MLATQFTLWQFSILHALLAVSVTVMLLAHFSNCFTIVRPMNSVSAWQFAYSAYWNSVFLGHKWDFSLNGVAPLVINNSAGTWKDAGRWGGIWQNTCSKLTKTSVRLLFTTVSNSCKNPRFLRVFCVVWEQHDRCLGSWKTFARSWSPARHGPAKVARVHWTHH